MELLQQARQSVPPCSKGCERTRFHVSVDRRGKIRRIQDEGIMMTNSKHVWHEAFRQLPVSCKDADRVRYAPAELQSDVIEWLLNGGDGPDDEHNPLTEKFVSVTLDQCLVCDQKRVNSIEDLDDPRDMLSTTV